MVAGSASVHADADASSRRGGAGGVPVDSFSNRELHGCKDSGISQPKLFSVSRPREIQPSAVHGSAEAHGQTWCRGLPKHLVARASMRIWIAVARARRQAILEEGRRWRKNGTSASCNFAWHLAMAKKRRTSKSAHTPADPTGYHSESSACGALELISWKCQLWHARDAIDTAAGANVGRPATP
jgi:hypothetical protein